MKITARPDSIYGKKYNDELEKCTTCPFCGNRDSMYGYPEDSKVFEDFGLIPIYVTYISTNKSKGIFSRLFESLFCDNLYKILHYKCPQCGTEYESDPLLIVHKGESVV